MCSCYHVLWCSLHPWKCPSTYSVSMQLHPSSWGLALVAMAHPACWKHQGINAIFNQIPQLSSLGDTLINWGASPSDPSSRTCHSSFWEFWFRHMSPLSLFLPRLLHKFLQKGRGAMMEQGGRDKEEEDEKRTEMSMWELHMQKVIIMYCKHC